MPRPNPAFLIEGQMEQRIIQKICRDAPAVKIGVNGDEVNVTTIVRFCVARIRILRGKHWPFIIVFDRERRAESAEALARAVSALVSADLPGEDIRVVVADRTIENWILFDHEMLNEKFGLSCSARNADGALKAELERLLPNRQYHETTLGVEMFTACRPSRMTASASFMQLRRAVTFECHWMQR